MITAIEAKFIADEVLGNSKRQTISVLTSSLKMPAKKSEKRLKRVSIGRAFRFLMEC